MLRRFFQVVVAPMVLLLPISVWAAHPLITDDTGTLGKGKFQLEINGQYDTDRETNDGVYVKSTGGQAAAVLSYGVIDGVDLIVGLPYLWNKVKEDGVVTYNDRGFSDTTLDAKWRVFEKDGISLALKQGFSFPTGRDNRGLGSGKIGSHTFIILTEERGPLAFHLNLGYIWNDNTVDERVELWHASIATTYEIVKGLKLAVDTGTARTREKGSERHPVYILGGVIFSPSANFDIDLGVKTGLNKAETDLSYMAGITLRF
jgi:hypothetical protein